MASLSAIRSGIKTNLATISGLRSSDFQPDNPSPPIAIVFPDSISYDTAFARGLNTYQFVVSVISHRSSERTAQSQLDAYVSSTGSQSIKRAIESDKTLGGVANDVRVTDLRVYGSTIIGDVNYAVAEFSITVIAD